MNPLFERARVESADLVERIRAGAPLNAVDSATIHAKGATGYTDYPFWSFA